MADISIYGLLRSKAADGKIAVAEQIYSESEGKFQSDINAETVRSVSVRGVEITESAPLQQDNILYIEVKPDTDGQ